jgi:hypothetical protein
MGYDRETSDVLVAYASSPYEYLLDLLNEGKISAFLIVQDTDVYGNTYSYRFNFLESKKNIEHISWDSDGRVDDEHEWFLKPWIASFFHLTVWEIQTISIAKIKYQATKVHASRILLERV